MILKTYFVYIFAITSFTDAVKVNMHGSLSLGKDVMDTITHYFRNGYSSHLLNWRRSMNAELDPIALEVKSESLCKRLEFCNGKLEKFVNDYVTALAHTVEGVFDGIMNAEGKGRPFFGVLKIFLDDVRKLLKTADEKVTDDREAYLWVGVIKKISAKFQKKTITYIVDKLEADPKEIDEIKKKLTQSLVIDIALTEAKAQKRLCYEFHICLNFNECTTALNSLLSRLKKLPHAKIKKFMKAFYEALEDSSFYSKLRPKTAKEFQDILNDMSYSDNVPAKEILNSIQETIETRLNTMYSSTDLTKGQDIQLVHMILSDLDYIYSKHKSSPCRDILDNLLEWTRTGQKIKSYIKDAILSLEKGISSTTEELVVKLLSEVRVFLEITVDSEQ